jgi:hypothetical protein
MVLQVGAAFDVLAPYAPKETADLGDITPVLQASDDKGECPKEHACEFNTTHRDDESARCIPVMGGWEAMRRGG